jgi:glycosyltransferase involved in cell wall biosynthesis
VFLSRVDVLHVCSAPSPRQFTLLRDAVKPLADDVEYGMPESSFQFHNLLRRGLSQNDGVRVRSLVGRPISPAIHRGRFWRTATERISPTLTIHQVSVLNLPVVKQLWVGLGVFADALRWRAATSKRDTRVLIVDAAYVSVLPWALLALVGSGTRKLGLFADVYSYMGAVADARDTSSAKQRAVRRVIKAIYGAFDGFILLTKQMNAVVNPKRKPHVIMEGLVDQAAMDDAEEARSDAPTIVYAGALRKEYGLDDLLEGFLAVERDDVRLVFYGGGPFEKDIVAASRVDGRVTFGGRVPVSEVMRIQRRAWLLANTRRIDDEFTKYSFPSKMLSYMASGTPVLTTKLPGMPDEYNEHVFLVDGQGASAVTEAVNRVLSLPLSTLDAQGTAARGFVAERKNNVFQAARVLEFAKDLP